MVRREGLRGWWAEWHCRVEAVRRVLVVEFVGRVGVHLLVWELVRSWRMKTRWVDAGGEKVVVAVVRRQVEGNIQVLVQWVAQRGVEGVRVRVVFEPRRIRLVVGTTVHHHAIVDVAIHAQTRVGVVR